jgi:DNA gyrase subunit A
MVKKTSLAEYDSPRTGLAAINLKEGDELIDVFMTGGKDDIFMVSRNGQTIRFKEETARPMGRSTAGVIGMRLREGDEVLAVGQSSSGVELISVTGNGYGKRTDLKHYPRKGRGGLGVVGHKLTKKTGSLAGAFIGSKDQDVFLVSSSGIVIRVPAEQIRRVGRASQGVRTMRVEEGAHVVAMAPVVTKEEEDLAAVAGGDVPSLASASPTPLRRAPVGKKTPASPAKKPVAKRKTVAKKQTAAKKKTPAKRTTAKKTVTKKKTVAKKRTTAGARGGTSRKSPRRR